MYEQEKATTKKLVVLSYIKYIIFKTLRFSKLNRQTKIKIHKRINILLNKENWDFSREELPSLASWLTLLKFLESLNNKINIPNIVIDIYGYFRAVWLQKSNYVETIFYDENHIIITATQYKFNIPVIRYFFHKKLQEETDIKNVENVLKKMDFKNIVFTKT